jgi:hypothetical protein
LDQVFKKKSLPMSLLAVMNSRDIVKVGTNIEADLAALRQDFPTFQLARTSDIGAIELTQLAEKKAIIPSARDSSLAEITHAALGLRLPKVDLMSSWASPTLSKSQTASAALDAWIRQCIYHSLHCKRTAGQSLDSASPVGQLVSLLSCNHEVAHGRIVQQPATFDISHGNSTKMHRVTADLAVIEIDTVIAPGHMLTGVYRKRPLSSFGQTPFKIIVFLTSLQTWVAASTTSQTDLAPFLSSSTSAVPLPIIFYPPSPAPDGSSTYSQDINEIFDNADGYTGIEHGGSDDESGLESDGETYTTSPSTSEPSAYLAASTSLYTQPPSSDPKPRPSRILLDIFHVMDRIGRALTPKHSAYHAFMVAFSDTLFVCDEHDRAQMEAHLLATRSTWKLARLSRPDWLWERVRRYVPPPDTLYSVLEELFRSWRDVRCIRTGLPLFTTETKERARGVLEDVRWGWVSDPKGIPMYSRRGVDKFGFVQYHCERGTSSLEGGTHMVMRRKVGTLHAGIELLDCLMADWRHRHNTMVCDLLTPLSHFLISV